MTAWHKIVSIACAAVVAAHHNLHALTNLTRNDPYPVFTTAEPDLLLTREYRISRRIHTDCYTNERLRFSASMYRQRASVGTDFWNRKYTPLGDLDGRWNMTALLFPEANGNTEIKDLLATQLNLTSNQECLTIISDPTKNDIRDEFGFFSVQPLYRKFGARFELEIYLGWDLGLRVQAGVTDIRQTVTFVDLTCSATGLSCPVNDCVTICDEATGEATTGSCTPGNCCVDVFKCSCKENPKSRLDNFLDLLHKDLAQLELQSFDVVPFLKDRDYRGVFRVIE